MSGIHKGNGRKCAPHRAKEEHELAELKAGIQENGKEQDVMESTSGNPYVICRYEEDKAGATPGVHFAILPSLPIGGTL